MLTQQQAPNTSNLVAKNFWSEVAKSQDSKVWETFRDLLVHIEVYSNFS